MEDTLKKAFQAAKEYEMKNGGCPQSCIAGIFEALEIENDDVFRAATGFADGVGLTGNGHCGALSGGAMAISYLYGRKREEFSDSKKQLKALMLSKKLVDQFAEKHGTCRCADIQTKEFGRFFNFYDPADIKAAFKAGLPDKCSTMIGEVAAMTTKIILEERARQAAKG